MAGFFYRETYNYVLCPPPQGIEFTCIACGEPVYLELNAGDITDINSGCDNCGVSITINAKLIITARQE
jgi:hypothetical protein